MESGTEKVKEKFRIFVPVGKKEIYYREAPGKILFWENSHSGEVISTSLLAFALGRGFYRPIIPKTMDFKEQVIQAQQTEGIQNRDVFVDVGITWRIGGGLTPNSKEAEEFFKRSEDEGLIKSRNKMDRREFWKSNHPLITFYQNETAIIDEYNAVKDGKDHKTGMLETIVTTTLRKYLTNLPYFVIQNIDNAEKLKAECEANSNKDKNIIYNYDDYKDIYTNIKEEIEDGFWNLGMQIDKFALKNIHGSKDFEKQQEELANLDIEKQKTEKQNEIDISIAEKNQTIANMQSDQKAYEASVIGAAEADVLSKKASALESLSANQIAAMNGNPVNVNSNEYNINGLDKIVGAFGSISDIASSVKKTVNTKENSNVTSYKEVEDDDIFTEKEEVVEPINVEENTVSDLFDEEEPVVENNVKENEVKEPVVENNVKENEVKEPIATKTIPLTNEEIDNLEENIIATAEKDIMSGSMENDGYTFEGSAEVTELPDDEELGVQKVLKK